MGLHMAERDRIATTALLIRGMEALAFPQAVGLHGEEALDIWLELSSKRVRQIIAETKALQLRVDLMATQLAGIGHLVEIALFAYLLF